MLNLSPNRVRHWSGGLGRRQTGRQGPDHRSIVCALYSPHLSIAHFVDAEYRPLLNTMEKNIRLNSLSNSVTALELNWYGLPLFLERTLQKLIPYNYRCTPGVPHSVTLHSPTSRWSLQLIASTLSRLSRFSPRHWRISAFPTPKYCYVIRNEEGSVLQFLSLLQIFIITAQADKRFFSFLKKRFTWSEVGHVQVHSDTSSPSYLQYSQ